MLLFSHGVPNPIQGLYGLLDDRSELLQGNGGFGLENASGIVLLSKDAPARGGQS